MAKERIAFLSKASPLWLGWIHEPETDDVIDAHDFELQGRGHEVDPVDGGCRDLAHRVEVVLRIQTIAYSRRRSSCTARTLFGLGTGDRAQLKE